MIDRETASLLLDQHVRNEYQKLHALMVAEALESYARNLGEDVELWYVTGLLHDLDFEEFPEQHPAMSIEWLTAEDVPDEMIHAIAAHAYSLTGEEPETKLASYLLAVDELSGFMYAYSLMRPKGFSGMRSSKVVKKLKDKTFASKISREDIFYGIERAELDLHEHIQFLIGVFDSETKIGLDCS